MGLSKASRPSDGAVLPEPIAVTSGTAAASSSAPDAVPTQTAPLASQYQSTTISISNARPAPNATVGVVLNLRGAGEPAVGVPVYLTVQYRTVQERWPKSGTVDTDSDGAASIQFNVGNATPGYEVKVVAHAQVDGQDLTWPTTFTPG
jgi:hypothetical protein